jgi:hypothetical protein
MKLINIYKLPINISKSEVLKVTYSMKWGEIDLLGLFIRSLSEPIGKTSYLNLIKSRLGHYAFKVPWWRGL